LASHHFIGKGSTSATLKAATEDVPGLSATIRRLVEDSGLKVVDEKQASFPGGGLTLVWILAESHLVLHYWAEEGFSTLDLHVCDYDRSNADKAAVLARSLEEFCFAPDTAHWQELSIEDPAPRPRAALS
jgi:S-adenosylmethionine/arginine decarboxylase-like enzyme